MSSFTFKRGMLTNSGVWPAEATYVLADWERKNVEQSLANFVSEIEPELFPNVVLNVNKIQR